MTLSSIDNNLSLFFWAEFYGSMIGLKHWVCLLKLSEMSLTSIPKASKIELNYFSTHSPPWSPPILKNTAYSAHSCNVQGQCHFTGHKCRLFYSIYSLRMWICIIVSIWEVKCKFHDYSTSHQITLLIWHCFPLWSQSLLRSWRLQGYQFPFWFWF